MYTHFFHFRETPFSITPDPAFLYLSPRHHEALAHLLYGTGESGGFVQLTGEVGTGKTTVIRTLLEQRMPEVDVALILNPRQTAPEFLQSICDELGVAYAEPISLKGLVDALNRHLLATHAQNRRTVLIIDEAQNLSEDLLEQVRLLTNLETSKQKLLRIMLIGQPELDELLARPGLRQLAQRITARFHLTALSRDETCEYIAHRLRVAGGDAAIFDAPAMRAVYRHSGGVPRLINVLCDRALLAAYGANEARVSAARVAEAARSLGHGRRQGSSAWQRWRPALPWVPGVALAGMIAAAWWWSLEPAPDATPDAQVAAAAVTPQASQTPQTPQTPRPEPAAAPPIAPESGAENPDPDTLGVDEPAVEPLHMPRVTDTEAMLAGLPSLGEQVALLLGQWDAAIRLDGEQPVCEAIRDAQLRCLRERNDWAALGRYDRPAILTLVEPDGGQRYALLRRLFDAHAEVVVDNRLALVSRAALDRLWSGEFLLFWRDYGPEGVIRPGDSGEAVRWLRRSLAQIEEQPMLTEAAPEFDGALRNRVEAFQRSQALKVDGHVGEKTRLMLMQKLHPDDGPRLRPEGG